MGILVILALGAIGYAIAVSVRGRDTTPSPTPARVSAPSDVPWASERTDAEYERYAVREVLAAKAAFDQSRYPMDERLPTVVYGYVTYGRMSPHQAGQSVQLFTDTPAANAWFQESVTNGVPLSNGALPDYIALFMAEDIARSGTNTRPASFTSNHGLVGPPKVSGQRGVYQRGHYRR
jgi:hypothetical protein